MDHFRVRSRLWRLVLAVAALATVAAATGQPASADKLASRLASQEFWRLATGFSEADGTFHSENLVSNEARFQSIVPALEQTAVPGRAYLGVGSEQNFTYIVAVRPAIAFILDIRRGNLDLHLLYKALFELSADRAEFVSRLFSRPRPVGLGAASSAEQIFSAYAQVAPSRQLFFRNLNDVRTQLETRHGFTLSDGDRRGLEFVYSAWFEDGPDIHYELIGGFGRGRGGRGGPGGFPSYADLMTATDDTGRNRSYLASETSFRFVKDLEARNLVVPVVGNFGGPKALRAIGAYLKQKETVVSAFYLSNVEQYLRQDGLWDAFCANAATLPVDRTSTFIRSERGGFGGPRRAEPGFALELAGMAETLAVCRR